MNLGLDIDGVITAAPVLLRQIALGWPSVHFITARHERDRDFTHQQLLRLGFNLDLWADGRNLHMFPDHYDWPFPDEDSAQATLRAHAEWKARKCVELNIGLMIDDSPLNLAACVAAGIPTLLFSHPSH